MEYNDRLELYGIKFDKNLINRNIPNWFKYNGKKSDTLALIFSDC